MPHPSRKNALSGHNYWQSKTMQLPSTFSPLEQCQAFALLEEVQSATRTYTGDFTAPWLLSAIHAPIWRISRGEETRMVEGHLTNYDEYSWATELYDGSNLIEPANKLALHGAQKLAFLAREMPGGPKTLSTLKNFLWSLNFLIRWAYLNGDVLKPRQHLLTKMTMQHFTDLITDLGKGGVAFALRYPERILLALFPLALGRKPTQEELDDPFSLEPADCLLVAEWLKSRDGFKKVARSDRNSMTIKRSVLANLIGVDVAMLRGGPRWTAFLGQFELSDVPYAQRISNNRACERREFPSQKSVTIEEAQDAQVSEKTIHKYLDDLKVIVCLHRHLPEVCPEPAEFRLSELRQTMVEASQERGHTPWVPLDVAMSYTTEALRWIHVYGEDLVTIFLSAYRELNARGVLVSAPAPDVAYPSNADYAKAFKKVSDGREQYIADLLIPRCLAPLNLTGWGTYFHLDGKKGCAKLQKSPSLLDAIMVLIGAITVIVAMVKPIRESELRALKRDCLTFVDGDGYWLSQDIRKKNVHDVRPVDSRPIPVIAATAIQLLRRLTDGLKEIAGVTDPWVLESLMTFPSFGRYDAKIDDIISAQQLGAFLDAFCDYVALAPDANGRRWYLRVHEMRKSFLITFFWTYRYASLDAARWMAGHGDASHVYAYIQANFPGEELPGLEAEYAAQVLRDYQQSGTATGIKDVASLYQAVCDQFSVRDVSWIDETLLKDWLELQFESKEFQIVPYSMRNPDGGTVTEIAFRISSSRKESLGG